MAVDLPVFKQRRKARHGSDIVCFGVAGRQSVNDLVCRHLEILRAGFD